MTENIFPVPESFARTAHITREKYNSMYAQSAENPDKFWAGEAEKFLWRNRWKTVKDTRYAPDVSIKWFEGGQLNLSENCLDRHLASHGDKVAIIWEGDDPEESRKITYRELHEQVCKFANVLKSQGVKRGDRVTIYLPMIPEAAISMLACARIGAVHSVVFGGFSADAIKGRIEDCGSEIVITADEGFRGGK
ncbi:MAG: acetyl-coenzyme A synthetase, partial [Alphaproteobacteria bacterium]|nr:acetyl-coenzyme A synthetase [Alphaproteobacteria bacterium]